MESVLFRVMGGLRLDSCLSGVKKATEDSVLSKTELNCYFYFYMFIVNDVAIWAQ